jgi:hypothetical protein
MQNINAQMSLRETILELERRQAEEGKLLKQQFYTTYESMQPINIIKNTFKEAALSNELKDNILTTSVGLVVGYLSKMLFEDISTSPVKKLLGTIILFGITNIVAKNPETVKSLGKGFLKIILSKSKERLLGLDN